MRVYLSPQVAPGPIAYTFGPDSVTATIDGASDTFNFGGLADGEGAVITTTLPVQPIVRAYRAGGVLHLVLLNRIDADASEAERWPTWQEV